MSEASEPGTDLGSILRGYLREAIAKDRQPFSADAGAYPMGLWPLEQLRSVLEDVRRALAARDPRNVAATVNDLMEGNGLPEALRHQLGIGVLEAEVRRIQEAIRLAQGEAPMVFVEDVSPAPTVPAPEGAAKAQAAPPEAELPTASTLTEPFFTMRETLYRQTHKQTDIERTTIRLFLAVCGDKPFQDYSRRDVTAFLDTLRKLPSSYNKSPRDRERTLSDIIEEANAKGKERLSERTVQRHLTSVSQFLRFAVDSGHMTVAARTELVEGHRFREERSARGQRDAYTPEELVKLFSAPVWTGCAGPARRGNPGPYVYRDAYFWLPLLALYQGGRLEELADLRRADVAQDGGVWRIRVAEEEGRRLKNGNAARLLPLHPEIIRMGFLEDIARVAVKDDDPLFPELTPRGKDQRRGLVLTKWFTRYRRGLGLDRDGLSFHSFRHTAITRITDAITNEQQRRHRDFMMGHARQGGEGDLRYDKGPGLKAAAETLALLRYPELELPHLYRGCRT